MGPEVRRGTGNAMSGGMEMHAPARRIGLIADVRANATALAAILAELRGAAVDRIVALGDLAGDDGHAPETLTALRRAGVHAVTARRGAGARGRPAVYRPTPSVLCICPFRGDATSRLDEFRDFAAEAARLRAREPAVAVCCFGHTHRARAIAVRDSGGVIEMFDAEVTLPDDALTFINPGAAGRRRHDEPAAAFAILDLPARKVSFRQVRYEPTTGDAGTHHLDAGPLIPAMLRVAMVRT